ncbi:MAG: ribonuclease P protein component [Halothece sp.]
MGLPKANRLKHPKEFKTVYQKGGRTSGKYLILRTWKPITESSGETSLPPTQVGISISQKVSKRAVVRNRIKRQVRAIMRSFLPELPSGWKIVVIVKPQAQGCKYEDFLRELRQLLIKSEVLYGD